MTTRKEREVLNREYLKNKVDCHLNKLIIELLRDKPEDVLSFILNWAQKHQSEGGKDTKSREMQPPAPVEDVADETNEEQNLREDPPAEEEKGVDGQEAPKQEDAPKEEANDGQKDQAEADTETMNMEDIPKEDRAEGYLAPDVESGDEAEDDEGGDEVDMDAFLVAQKKNSMNAQRISVSAEVYGTFNQKQVYVPKVVEKADDAKDAIRERLNQAFMFASLDDKEKDIVINAMEECKFCDGDLVIKEGDDGAVLYLVFSGTLKCSKRLKKEDEEDTFLLNYKEGEAFGELALLYNAPRAATIVSVGDSVCYSLDRDCFNNIVKESTIKRRERFEDFVGKIELLQCLDSYERSKITDCLNTDKYKENDLVITQGEVGNKFYFIEEGTAKATKKSDDGAEEVVYEYKENDYFGELALLKDEPRAANIVATSDLTVAWIDRFAFKRLLGPLENVLERNAEKYSKFVQG